MKTHEEVRRELAAALMSAGGYTAFARKAGVTHSTVERAVEGKRVIGEKLAAALGYRRVVGFVPR